MVRKINESVNCDKILEILFLSHNLFLPKLFLIRVKIKTSKKSDNANAIRLAKENRIEPVNIWSYAFSFGANRVDGGSDVARIAKRNMRIMTNNPDLIILLVLSGP